MKLLALFEALETPNVGTFVGARFDQETIDNLMSWMASLGLEETEPADELHTTILLDKENEFEWDTQEYDTPIEVSPDSYSMELFGTDENVLVLKYVCDELEARHNAGKEEHGIEWDFPDYSPHVTLSYSGDTIVDLDEVELPDFPLLISSEYTQPFNHDYA